MSYTYAVHPLDVWGNARDGYSVNDVYPSQGNVTIPANATDAQILSALKREGFAKRGIRASSVRIDGEVGYSLYIDYRGKPVYELRRVGSGDRRRGLRRRGLRRNSRGRFTRRG